MTEPFYINKNNVPNNMMDVNSEPKKDDSQRESIYTNRNNYCNSKSLIAKNNIYIDKAKNIINTGIGDNTGIIKNDVNRYRQILQNDWNKCCKNQIIKSKQCNDLNNTFIELGKQIKGGKNKSKTKQKRPNKKWTNKKRNNKKWTNKKRNNKNNKE